MISFIFLISNLCAAPYVKFPNESNEQLRTPGVGFQESLSRIPADIRLQNCDYDTSLDSDDDNDVKAGSVYIRMMWQDFEPTEGNYAWDKLDKIFECARKKGQTVDIRVMLNYPGNTECYWQELQDNPNCKRYESLPQWLLDKGINPYITNVFTDPVHNYYVPNWDNSTLWNAHKDLINALGNKYDGHPELNSIDIGSLGIWGEWHIFGNDALMPSEEKQKEIIDIYTKAFPRTRLVPLGGAYTEGATHQTSYGDVASYLRNKNLAWRVDSWGDKEDNYFPTLYEKLNKYLSTAWKSSPVILETSDTFSGWIGNPNFMSIDKAMDDALRWHASLLHNKGDEIPATFKNVINEKAKKLGFRLVLRKVSYDTDARKAKTVNIDLDWENIGVAPPYRDYRIALRLRDKYGNVVPSSTLISNHTVKGMLPGGIRQKTISYNISDSIPSGNYNLDVALVLNTMHTPYRILPIAVTGREKDGWYKLGNLSINNTTNNLDIGNILVPIITFILFGGD